MKLVLIGSGHFGTHENEPYNMQAIDDKIIQMANKAHPRFLFIGFNIRANRIFGAIKKNMLARNVQCEYLNYTEFGNQKSIDCKFKRADIIYIGGGNTIFYMQQIKKYGLDKKLIESLEQNKVLAGLSAGAIILSKFGSSDSRHYKNGNKFTSANGLGFLNVFLSPHFTKSGREEEMPRLMKNKKSYVSVGLDDLCALAVDGDRFEVVKSEKEAKAFKMYYDKDKFVKKNLDDFGNLSDLLSKQ